MKLKCFLSLLLQLFCPIHWSQVIGREWRYSWSSADRRCSNYIWVIYNFIAYLGVSYNKRFDGRSSWLESQIINIKLKKNHQKVPGPPPKLLAKYWWTGVNFQHWLVPQTPLSEPMFVDEDLQSHGDTGLQWPYVHGIFPFFVLERNTSQ